MRGSRPSASTPLKPKRPASRRPTTSWKDLLKPEYKGMIVRPNQNSSGTGFLDVSSWLQFFGEAEGWKYMDALHENIASYTHSGSKPCKMAASGEAVMGISFAFRDAKEKAAGPPIEVIVPSEGAGWDMEDNRHHRRHVQARCSRDARRLDGHQAGQRNVNV